MDKADSRPERSAQMKVFHKHGGRARTIASIWCCFVSGWKAGQTNSLGLRKSRRSFGMVNVNLKWYDGTESARFR